MAAFATSYCEDHLGSRCSRPETRQQKTGLGNGKLGWAQDGLEQLLLDLCEGFNDANEHANGATAEPFDTQSVHRLQDQVSKHDLKTISSVATLDPLPPPSYEDSINDAPPDYTATDTLARVCCDWIASFTPTLVLDKKTSDNHLMPAVSPGKIDVDLRSPENVRSHVKKKDKKAAKQAQMSKWGNEDDDEEKKEGGEGGEDGENGGGDGGSGAGGDGGEGGGDDDGWDDGKKKKGKKGKKKTAWEELEEEEEKKRKEEEEAAQKAEDDAAADGGGADAGDANGEDDWGGFNMTAKEKKKAKKKGKNADPDPPPEEPAMDTIDLGASTGDVAAAGDANPDDDWGFSTGKKKKGKKGKVGHVVSPVSHVRAMFHLAVEKGQIRLAAPLIAAAEALGPAISRRPCISISPGMRAGIRLLHTCHYGYPEMQRILTAPERSITAAASSCACRQHGL